MTRTHSHFFSFFVFVFVFFFFFFFFFFILSSCSELVVDFRLQLSAAAVSSFATPKGREQILNSLNLSSRFSISNIHLWSVNGTIQKYSSASQIIDEHFGARLELYERRKLEQQARLQQALAELECRHKFCRAVVDGSLILFGKPRAEIEAELKGRLQLAEHATKGGYGYLLNTAVVDLTSDKLQDLSERLVSTRSELELLKATTPKDLWKNELLQLRSALETR